MSSIKCAALMSSATTTCSPLNSCYTSTTIWPPSSNRDNKVGKKITISAMYQFSSPFLFFWPATETQQVGTIWLPASSTQTILF